MAMSGYPFPFDLANLAGGAVRILYAPVTESIPTTLTDIFDLESPYAAAGDWVDFGATSEPFTATRGFDTEGWQIEQTTGNVIEDITDTTRSWTVPIAELHADTLKIIENQADETAIAAVANASAQTKVSFGSILSPVRYRMAFISRRNRASGVVTESDTTTERGRFLGATAHQVQIAADDVEFEFGKGALTGVNVTFTLFPDTTVTASEDAYGDWYDEAAGTISAV